MITHYRKELESLNLAYSEALKIDISSLSYVVGRWLDRPMVMIGSGGSYSAASFAAYLHETLTGYLARAATPLEVISNQVADAGAVCFTASGRNRDIRAAFTASAVKEMKPLCALVMANQTPMHKIGERYPYSDVIGISNPHFKDGFLAVASLIATAILLIRAYRQTAGTDCDLPNTLSELMTQTMHRQSMKEIATASEKLMERSSVSVLYTNALKPASVDIESRFVEAAIGPLHTADFRNFGHGRHYWFAKRASEASILALVGDGMGKLAERTLKFLPEDAPTLRVDFDGPAELQALAGLVVGLYISEGAARISGVDPGKPSVPEFGRRLYHLGPGMKRIGQAELNRLAALRRKGVKSAINSNAVRVWSNDYSMVLGAINSARFKGVVLDYDGTICDQRYRYDPIHPRIAQVIERLVESGLVIGVATGRGSSAGKAMRARLPEAVWSQILVGYYNGALITDLGNTACQLATQLDEKDPLLQSLQRDLLFSGREIRANQYQISITLDTGKIIDHAVGVATRLSEASGRKSTKVVASGHSIDILLAEQSKLDVVAAVATCAGGTDKDILRIGDMGIWPGNDAELLDHPLGLTVDEASPNKYHCWGLAPAGVKGLQAALYYLERIKWGEDGGRLIISAGEKGVAI